MRKALLFLVGTALLAAPAAAQQPDAGGRATELRRRIEDRFAARVQEALGLDDKQAVRLREVVGSYFVKRRALEAEERRIRQDLAGELRPGVAADKDHVARLTDQLLDNKVRYVQSYQDEMKELATFLDPVQRAQFLIMRERLLEQIRRAQERTQDTEDQTAPPRRRLLRP
jgi:LTXXQ motif family protein